jgi:simple sugar transport system permease protein
MVISMMIALFIASAVRMSVPLLLGTLGESLTERAGNLNLGVEGLMMMGAAAGFLAAYHTDSILLAVLAGMLGSGFGALLYAILTITFRTKQDVTGLALTIFGSGFANTLGKSLANQNTPAGILAFAQAAPLHLVPESAAGRPVIGPVLTFLDTAFLQHNWFVYLAYILAILGWIYLFRTRAGLNLRMVGENRLPPMRPVSGYWRQICAGYPGRHSLRPGRSLYFRHQRRHLSGEYCCRRGWIVVRWLSSFAGTLSRRSPARFCSERSKSSGFASSTLKACPGFRFFPSNAIDMYPYLMTIIVLVITYARRQAYQGPAALGVPYFREDR